VKGATVYFPSGRYLVSSSIIAMYHTQLIGDPHDFPTIASSQQFTDLGVISSDVYTGEYNHRWGSDGEWYLNTANFFRQVRNFVIDTRATTTPEVKGIHCMSPLSLSGVSTDNELAGQVAQGNGSTNRGQSTLGLLVLIFPKPQACKTSISY
jgi:hypothetical protein